jgi:glycopeptide antibiotics resistance protein
VRLFALVVISAATLAGCPGAAGAADDPCGGTGGIGTVVSAGKASFTITRHDDRVEQVVHLARPPAIRTANGSISPAGLRPGDSVTLVGDPQSDGGFTAAAVVVCEPRPHEKRSARGPRSGRAPAAASTRPVTSARPVDPEQADLWRARIDRGALLLVGLTWIGMLTLLRVRKRQGRVYLLVFTLFFVYVVVVLDRTLFQFQSLIVLKHFAPHLMLNGQGDGNTVELVPLVTLTSEDLATSLLNVLLMVPFGFGLPAITTLRFAGTVTAGVLFSVAIEVLQLVTGLVGGVTFRIADVNDVIFNATGVVLGYWLFDGLVRVCRGVPGLTTSRQGWFR